MSESDVRLKTSASTARFIEAMRIIRHQVCQLNMLMRKSKQIEDTQAEEDEEA